MFYFLKHVSKFNAVFIILDFFTYLVQMPVFAFLAKPFHLNIQCCLLCSCFDPVTFSCFFYRIFHHVSPVIHCFLLSFVSSQLSLIALSNVDLTSVQILFGEFFDLVDCLSLYNFGSPAFMNVSFFSQMPFWTFIHCYFVVS